jgi:histidine triad (HIT) family protein
MPSIFTRIINGEIPCYKIAESEECFAFLDIRPLKQGHTLVVPKKEVDDMFDLDEDTYLKLHLFAKKVASAIKQAFPCNRISTLVIGLEVPHCHIHLVPLDKASDVNISKKPLVLSVEQMTEIAEKIKQFL